MWVAKTEFGAGDTVDFTIMVTNNGSAAAYDIDIKDLLPEGINDTAPSIVSVLIDNIDESANVTQVNIAGTTRNVNWRFDPAVDIPVGKSLVIRYTVTLDDDVIANIGITSTANIVEYFSHPSDTDRRKYSPALTAAVSIYTPTANDILKAVNKSTANIGDRVTYTITVPENAVDAELNNLTVTDSAPAGMSFDPSSIAITSGHSVTDTTSSSAVNLSLATLDPNEQLVFTIEAIANNNSNAGNAASNSIKDYDNTASFNYDEYVGSNIDSNTVTTTITEPDLSVSLSTPTVSPAGDIELGTKLTYGITVTNNGDGTAYDITIIDRAYEWLQSPVLSNAPTGLVLSPTTSSGSGDRTHYTLTYNAAAGIAPSGNISFDLTFTVSDASGNPVVAYATIPNDVDITGTSYAGTNPDSQERNGSGGANDHADSATTVSVNTGGITFDKALVGTDTNFSVGETFQYTLTFTGSKGTYEDLQFTDHLPTSPDNGLEYVATATVTDSANIQKVGSGAVTITSAPADEATGDLVFGFGDLEYTNTDGGDPMVEITVTVRLKDVNNSVDAVTLQTGASVQSTTPSFDIDATTPVEVDVVEPVLVLALDGPTDMTPGVAATLTARLEHETGVSSAAAHQPEIQVQLPAEMDDADPLTADSLPVVTIKDGARGTIILASGTDYTSSYASGILTVTLISTQARMELDENITVTFDAQVDDNVANGTAINPPYATITHYYSVENVAVPNEVRDYATTLGNASTTPNPLTDPGTIDAATGDDVTDNVEIAVSSPTLLLRQTVSPASSPAIAPGSVVTYTIEIENNGAIDATDVTLTDELATYFEPNTLTLVSVSPDPLTGNVAGEATVTIDGVGGTNSTGSITISDFIISTANDSSDPIQIVYKATLASVIPNGSVLTSNVILSSTGYDDLTDDVDTNIVSAPILEIEQISTEISDGAVPLQTGETLEYTITVRNTGNEHALNSILKDVVPGGTSYVADSTTLNGAPIGVPDGGVMPFASGEAINTPSASSGEMLVGGSDIIVTFQVTIDSGIVDGTSITNTATATIYPESAPTGTPLQKAAEVHNIIGNVGSVDSQKTVLDVNGGTLVAGDTLRYTMTVTNNGVADLTNVSLSDPIASDTTYVAETITYDNGSGVVAQSDAAGDDDSTFDGSTIEVTIGTLTAGSTVTITFDVTVNAGTADGTVITSQGTVSSNELPDEPTDQDGSDGNGDQPTDIVVGSDPFIRISKSVTDVNGGKVSVGDEIEYTITITNVGAGSASNVLLSNPGTNDTLFVASSLVVDGVADSDSVPFSNKNLGAIAPGDDVTLIYRATVDATAVEHTVLSVQSSFGYDGSDCAANSGATNCVSDADGDDGVENGNASDDTGDDDPTLLSVGGSAGIASVEGYIWYDINHSRAHDPSEEMLEGWKVAIYNDGVLVATTISDADGKYKFEGLAPGPNYSLEFFEVDTGTSFGPPMSGDGESGNSDGIPDGNVEGADDQRFNIACRVNHT